MTTVSPVRDRRAPTMQCGEEGQLQQRDWRKTQCGTHLGLLGDLAGKAAGALKHQSGCLFSPAFISMLSGSSWLTLTSEQQRPKGKARRGKKKKNILRLVNSGWHLNCGDRIHAKPLISKLHTTLSERENVVVVVVWRRNTGLMLWPSFNKSPQTALRVQTGVTERHLTAGFCPIDAEQSLRLRRTVNEQLKLYVLKMSQHAVAWLEIFTMGGRRAQGEIITHIGVALRRYLDWYYSKCYCNWVFLNIFTVTS